MRRTLAVLLIASLPLSPAAAQPFSILYHETVEAPTFAANVKPLGAAPAPMTSLSFEAFGRRFDLALERNERMAPVAAGENIGVELYRGEIVGQPGTWARINRGGRGLSGAIFDGVELYLIEPYESVSRHLALRRPNDGKTIVYRWSDVAGELRDELVSAPGAQRPQAAALLEGLMAAAALAPPKQLTVGFLVDTELSQLEGAGASDNLLATVNIVDGIFGGQVGLYITPQVQIFSSGTDPFTATEPLALLEEVEDYKFNTPALRALGLAHLFTGRDLDPASNTGRDIVGLANRGAVCEERFGAGITQATFGIGTNALIAAHEIGHNLGAPHDAETGSPCSASPLGNLMSPSLNGSSTLSQCSLDEIARTLAAKSCFESIPPSDVSLTLGSMHPNFFDGTDLELIVDSPPTGADARGVSLNLTLNGLDLRGASASGWTCPDVLPTLCTISRLPPGRSEHIAVTIRGAAPIGSLHAEVTSVNDPNAANNAVDHAFSFGPTADLAASMSPDLVESHPGEEHAVTITVRNQRFGDAVGVVATVSGGSNFAVLQTTPSQGSCASPSGLSYDCSLGTIPVGEARTIALRLKFHDTIGGPFRGFDNSVLRVQTSMPSTYEAAPRDNSAEATTVLSERFVDIAASIAGPAELALETTGRYTVTFVNNGPETAKDVLGQFILPFDAVTTIESVTGAGTCSVVDLLRIDCALPTMPPGQTFVLILNSRPTAEKPFRQVAIAHTPDWDRQLANNQAVVMVAVSGATASPPPSAPPSTPPSTPPSPPTTPPSSSPPAATPPPPSTGGGGGGGSTGGFELAALLAAAAAIRRAHARLQLRRARGQRR